MYMCCAMYVCCVNTYVCNFDWTYVLILKWIWLYWWKYFLQLYSSQSILACPSCEISYSYPPVLFITESQTKIFLVFYAFSGCNKDTKQEHFGCSLHQEGPSRDIYLIFIISTYISEMNRPDQSGFDSLFCWWSWLWKLMGKIIMHIKLKSVHC